MAAVAPAPTVADAFVEAGVARRQWRLAWAQLPLKSMAGPPPED